MSKKHEFKVNDMVVYPSHGVGKIDRIEKQKIGEHELQVFVIVLSKDNIILRVPVKRAEAIGLRAIESKEYLNKVVSTLTGKPRSTRGMWSRRAQEYETKINSGDIALISEVVRDLHKNILDPDRSYSERIIYEAALNRLAGEYAAIKLVSSEEAKNELNEILGEKELVV